MRIASLADRRASFAPHRGSKVGTEPLAEYFGRRTVLVIGGDDLMVLSVAKSSRAKPDRYVIKGMATRFSAGAAIDSRGYFLTASHAFEKKPPVVAFNEGEGIRIIPTRVVWRGNVSRGEPDLAVLHVPRKLDAVFRWAPDLTRGSLAFAAGVNSDTRRKFELACLAGRLERFSLDNRSRPVSTVIFHRVPLHPGDSGGPLTSSDGRLLGINTMVELSPFRSSPMSIAERPDLAWIRKLVAEDAAKSE